MRSETRFPVFWVETIVAILVLGLIAFAGLTALATRDKTIADETDNLARLSLMLAEHAQRVVFSADLIAASLEESIALPGVRSPEQFRRRVANRRMHDLLQERITLTSEVDALSLIDAHGNLINSARSWPPPAVNISDREYFITLRDNPDTAYVISPPLKNRVNQQDSIFLAHRFSAPDGTFLGVIMVTISASRFEKLYAAVLPNAGASIALYRTDGVLLVRQPQSDDAMVQSPEVQRFFRETLSRTEHGALSTRNVDAERAPLIMALQAVRGYPLMINVTNTEFMVLAEWWKLAQLIFAFAAAAILLVVLLGLAFIRVSKMQARVAETAEQLAHVNEELTATNKELEAFSYSIAHDLRAPLRAMIGFSSIVLDENRDKLGAASTKYLHRIHAGAMRMGLLIDDLLQLARISRLEMKRQDFNLSEVALSVAGALSETHPGRSVQLAVQPGLRANGDPGLVRVVLENLLGNAWKFTSRTDSARVEMGSEERKGETTYFLRDNGAGFDMRYSDKLFKAFQRLHSHDEFEGTGIGLSIVHRIVARHGGKVWGESELGKVTIFRFTLGKAAPSGRS